MGKKSSVSSICGTAKVLAYPLNRSQREPEVRPSRSSGHEYGVTQYVLPGGLHRDA